MGISKMGQLQESSILAIVLLISSGQAMLLSSNAMDRSGIPMKHSISYFEGDDRNGQPQDYRSPLLDVLYGFQDKNIMNKSPAVTLSPLDLINFRRQVQPSFIQFPFNNINNNLVSSKTPNSQLIRIPDSSKQTPNINKSPDFIQTDPQPSPQGQTSTNSQQFQTIKTEKNPQQISLSHDNNPVIPTELENTPTVIEIIEFGIGDDDDDDSQTKPTRRSKNAKRNKNAQPEAATPSWLESNLNSMSDDDIISHLIMADSDESTPSATSAPKNKPNKLETLSKLDSIPQDLLPLYDAFENLIKQIVKGRSKVSSSPPLFDRPIPSQSPAPVSELKPYPVDEGSDFGRELLNPELYSQLTPETPDTDYDNSDPISNSNRMGLLPQDDFSTYFPKKSSLLSPNLGMYESLSSPEPFDQESFFMPYSASSAFKVGNQNSPQLQQQQRHSFMSFKVGRNLDQLTNGQQKGVSTIKSASVPMKFPFRTQKVPSFFQNYQ